MEPEPVRAVVSGSAGVEPAAERVSPRFDADAELARRIASGDERAFEEFYRTHVRRVYAICMRLSADPERASRLVQDTFVLAWERMASFRGESRLSSWLHRIAVNVFIEGQRRRTRWGRVLAEGDGSADRLAGRRDDPELRVDLERCIAALPAGARTMLVLRDIEGYRYRDIAGLTGAAEGTVKAQVHRARRLLREMLES
ncbi:MAG: RNA polymerase sigma factor [Longimicrobiales bacterium]